MLEKDHVKPDGSTMDYEKNLARIATRGGNPVLFYFRATTLYVIVVCLQKLLFCLGEGSDKLTIGYPKVINSKYGCAASEQNGGRHVVFFK